MSVVYCRYPECDDVIGILNKLRESIAPLHVISDEKDVYAKKMRALETLVDKEATDKDTFIPLLSVKQNARLYGPQYKVSVVVNGSVEATGAVSRRCVNLICKDPPSTVLVGKIVDFARNIPGATVEHMDNFGRSLEIPV